MPPTPDLVREDRLAKHKKSLRTGHHGGATRREGGRRGDDAHEYTVDEDAPINLIDGACHPCKRPGKTKLREGSSFRSIRMR